MKTPLEVLQNCRKNLSIDISSFDNKKQKDFNELKLKLENELNDSLIKSIEYRPNNNCWFASIMLRKEYLSYFLNIHEFLNFINQNVNVPNGFKEIQPKEVKHYTKYNIRSVRYIFTLDE